MNRWQHSEGGAQGSEGCKLQRYKKGRGREEREKHSKFTSNQSVRVKIILQSGKKKKKGLRSREALKVGGSSQLYQVGRIGKTFYCQGITKKTEVKQAGEKVNRTQGKEASPSRTKDAKMERQTRDD